MCRSYCTIHILVPRYHFSYGITVEHLIYLLLNFLTLSLILCHGFLFLSGTGVPGVDALSLRVLMISVKTSTSAWSIPALVSMETAMIRKMVTTATASMDTQVQIVRYGPKWRQRLSAPALCLRLSAVQFLF